MNENTLQHKPEEPNEHVTAILTAHMVMLREIRSWGWWSLGLGVAHLIASGFLNAPWGVLLLAVGGASFYFREPPMFVIYGVTLAWAALSNLIGGQPQWITFALFQFYLVFRVFQQFFRFRSAHVEYTALFSEATPDTPTAPDRTARLFPYVGCLLGAASLTGAVALTIGIIVWSGIMGNKPPEFTGTVEGLIVNLGVLGLAVGIASLLAGYRHKWITALGLVASALVLIAELAFALLG